MTYSGTLRAILFATSAGFLVAGLPTWGAAAQPVPSRPAGMPADIYPESGNRLPLPRREDMNDADQKIFDEIMQAQRGGYVSKGEDRPPLRLHSPRLAHGLAEAHHYLKYETSLGERVMEIAILTTARELTNQYEWAQWVEHAEDPKDKRYLEPQVVDVIKTCKPVTGLAEKDAAVITLGREIFGRRKVSSATFAQALRLFGRRGVVDVVELMALYGATGAELVAFDMQMNPGQKPLLPANAKSCGH